MKKYLFFCLLPSVVYGDTELCFEAIGKRVNSISESAKLTAKFELDNQGKIASLTIAERWSRWGEEYLREKVFTVSDFTNQQLNELPAIHRQHYSHQLNAHSRSMPVTMNWRNHPRKQQHSLEVETSVVVIADLDLANNFFKAYTVIFEEVSHQTFLAPTFTTTTVEFSKVIPCLNG